MKTKNKTCVIKIFLTLTLTLTLSGCGFQLRAKSAFPTALNPVFFFSEKPYSLLSVELKQQFRAMHIDLAKQKTGTHFSIIVSNDNFIYDRPDIVDATLPTNINFSQTATISIINNRNNATVISQNFTASQSLTLNANQIYTSNSNTLIRQQLNHEMVSFIYCWLTATNTKTALTHATVTQTIKHTS